MSGKPASSDRDEDRVSSDEDASCGSPELAEVVTTLAHQIRNPLGSITNATYLLRQVLADEPNQDVARALEIVHDEAWRANRIITELLDYARPKTTAKQPTVLSELVDAELAALDIPDHVQLVRESTEPHTVHVDPDQTRRVLHHLLRNAVQAMDEGGELCIEIRRDGTDVVVEVSNTGPSIEPTHREKVFEPLHSTKSDGLGLGLATARALAGRQGATLHCRRAVTPVCFELRFGAVGDPKA